MKCNSHKAVVRLENHCALVYYPNYMIENLGPHTHLYETLLHPYISSIKDSVSVFFYIQFMFITKRTKGTK